MNKYSNFKILKSLKTKKNFFYIYNIFCKKKFQGDCVDMSVRAKKQEGGRRTPPPSLFWFPEEPAFVNQALP